MSSFAAACLQVNADEDMAANLDAALALAGQAADAGADLILMPENVAMMTWGADAVRARARPEAGHPALAAFRDFAKTRQVWLHGGTLAIPSPSGKVFNRTYVIDPLGRIVARYDKLHMFDVDLGGGEVYAESRVFEPGASPSICPGDGWGFPSATICGFPISIAPSPERGATSWRFPPRSPR